MYRFQVNYKKNSYLFFFRFNIQLINLIFSLSGADLASLIREAAVAALRTTLYSQSNNLSITEKLPDNELFVNASHFEMAFNKVSSSVSKSDKKKYDSLRIKFGCAAKNINQINNDI